MNELLYVEGYDEKWLAEDRTVVFLEDNPEKFFKAAPALAEHPKAHIRFIPDPKSLDLILENCAAEFPYDHIEIIGSRKLRLALLRKTASWHALFSEAIASHLFNKNILANIRRLPQAFSVNRWRGKFTGIPAVICGAGPSLAGATPILKKLHDRALIFAGGSTLSALSHFAVRPHLAMAIDPNAKEYDSVKGCKERDLPFLYCNRVLPKVFELFDGPYGFIQSMTGGSIESYLEQELGLKEEIIGPELGREAMSVTTMALALAYAFGCNPIVFVGVDMAYTGKQAYAEGVYNSNVLISGTRASERLLRRKNREKKTIYTLVKWVMESESISNFAKAHPDRTFINATPDGLGFKSIPYKPLNEVDLSKTFNMHQKVQEQIAQTRLTHISPEKVESALEKLRRSFERCLALIDKILTDPERKIVFEMDLHEELAYEAVLKTSLFAFEKVMASAPEEAKWKYLKECIQGHLAFHRE